MKFLTAAVLFAGLASLVAGAPTTTTTTTATVTKTKTITSVLTSTATSTKTTTSVLTSTATSTKTTTVYSTSTITSTKSHTSYTTLYSTVTRSATTTETDTSTVTENDSTTITSTATATETDTSTITETDSTTVTTTATATETDTSTITETDSTTVTTTATATETDSAAASGTSASSLPTTTQSSGICLTEATASNLVNSFASLLTSYDNNTADAILAPDFTDTSDSINYLAGIPLGSVTFASKTAFELGQGSQPSIGFQVDSIDAITCDVITFRWTAYLGTYPVKGIEVFYASNSDGTDSGWQISSLYSEFNVGAWELNVGNTCGNGATVAS